MESGIWNSIDIVDAKDIAEGALLQL